MSKTTFFYILMFASVHGHTHCQSAHVESEGNHYGGWVALSFLHAGSEN